MWTGCTYPIHSRVMAMDDAMAAKACVSSVDGPTPCTCAPNGVVAAVVVFAFAVMFASPAWVGAEGAKPRGGFVDCALTTTEIHHRMGRRWSMVHVKVPGTRDRWDAALWWRLDRLTCVP